MDTLKNVVRINNEIAASCDKYNSDINELKLLAVSKTHPASSIQAAYDAGITEFGESYLQEALEKMDLLKTLPVRWHFIGPIQSNKTRQIAENFDWVQSVDRAKLLTRLDQQRTSHLGPLNVCIQLNLFNEPQKKGASEQELMSLLELADKLPHINLRGLMIIPPKCDKFEAQRKQFKRIRQVFDSVKSHYPNMDTLSMGMSSDSEAAIAEGTTMLRIGTAIFGKRNGKTSD
jgi:pyridoxal phosphate enzyme (YggS family)